MNYIVIDYNIIASLKVYKQLHTIVVYLLF